MGDQAVAAPPARPRVLVADDEPGLARAFARVLDAAGFDVTIATNGREAAERLAQRAFDAVVSDIAMPEMDGIALLRSVRVHDLDVPVILMTGAADVATAIEAIEHGALRYLTKPVDLAQLAQTVARAVQLRQLVRMQREAFELARARGGLGVRAHAELDASFDRALDGLWMAYQPIVRVADRSTFGYEALLRSTEPTLASPPAVLDAAERLDRLPDLGRRIRAAVAATVAAAPARGDVFVNLHPRDLLDEDLFDAAAPLTAIASRVVLEITERASLDAITDARARVAALRARGFRIAIDDLGAGYAGLASFAAVEPEVVKLDLSLVRDIEQSSVKQKLVRSMTSLCRDMGMLVVAEGVETRAERDVLVTLGCDLLQGYLFAKPGRPFTAVTW